MDVPPGKRLMSSTGGKKTFKNFIEIIRRKNLDGYFKLIYEDKNGGVEGKIIFKNSKPKAAELKKCEEKIYGNRAVSNFRRYSSNDEALLELYTYSHSTSSLSIDQILSKIEYGKIDEDIDLLIDKKRMLSENSFDQMSDLELEKEKIPQEQGNFEKETEGETISDKDINLETLKAIKELMGEQENFEEEKDELDRYRKKLESKEEQVEKREIKLKEMEKKISKKEKDVKKSEKKLEKKEKNLENIRKSIEKEKKRLDSKLTEIKKENERQEKIKEEIENESEKLGERTRRLDQKEAEIEELEKEINEKKAEVEEKKERLEKKLEKLEKKEVGISKRREDLKERENELEEKEQELKELENDLDSKMETIEEKEKSLKNEE